MAPLHRIIIDTDPGEQASGFKDVINGRSIPNNATGVDDVLALLLALSAKPEELEILLLSVTYGNVEVDR